MPVVNITTWEIKDESIVEPLISDITRAVHQHTGAPLDKISVYLTEIPNTRWADAGVLGNDNDFPVKSRRTSYED